jgi:hypothetical protein
MIPKNGNRFSEKIMLKQKARARLRFHQSGKGIGQALRARFNPGNRPRSAVNAHPRIPLGDAKPGCRHKNDIARQ